MTETDTTLTDQQWRGLAQLGDLAQVATTLLESPLGGVIAGYLVQGTDMVPEGTMDAIEHMLKILVQWHENGTLDQVASGVSLLTSTLTPENITIAIEEPMEFLQSGVLADVKDALQSFKHGQQHEVGKFGGLGPMIRIMKDPDIQAGLWIMANLAGKIGSSVREHQKSS